MKELFLHLLSFVDDCSHSGLTLMIMFIHVCLCCNIFLKAETLMQVNVRISQYKTALEGIFGRKLILLHSMDRLN